MAFNMIEWSFEIGWDKDYGGLYYFLDSAGRSPPFLEWNMKLWWPHCEAMIAYSMIFKETRSEEAWNKFKTVTEYSLKHFSDALGGHGEWFGYCDRRGEVTHRFKGGPYKGCFHVPRALFMVINVLKSML